MEPDASPEQAASALSAGAWPRLCLVRNTHDASTNGYYRRLEDALKKQFPQQKTYFYRPRTKLDNMLIRALGWQDMSPYFYEVVEFDR
jgi:hypothetical protein